ncbi:MAG TPA: hypothetical protein VN824_04950, partial [Puia sp.]|nr:hypothetical protein [Puia sp.]
MYNRLIAAFLLLIANKSNSCIAQALPQDSISKHTYVYATRDSTELSLDVYRIAGSTDRNTDHTLRNAS